MRWIRNWLIAFVVLSVIILVVWLHFYFILAIATVIHDYNHLARFEEYKWKFLGGMIVFAVGLSTWYAISVNKLEE